MQAELLWHQRGASIIGTGLIALDVVLNERRQEDPRLWTGGTCGNVLAILAYLGWNAYPVGRLNHDAASRLIAKDLRRWDVDRRFLSLMPQAPAPVVIHRLRRNAQGENFHSFCLTCPECGQRLPSFRPISLSTVRDLREFPDADVFFSDRVSPGILALAERARAQGGVIAFEPSGVGDKALFQKMLHFAHIVKYSHDRLPYLPFDTPRSVLVEIQTLGKGGLQYRSRLGRARSTRWLHVEAFELARSQDTAGAGDWCMAGLIHLLTARGQVGLEALSAARVRDAVLFAQALAAWNCGFDGARGGMYEVTRADFRASIENVLRTKAHVVPEVEAVDKDVRVVATICSSCRQGTRRGSVSRLVRTAS